MSSEATSSSYGSYSSSGDATWLQRFLARPELQHVLTEVPMGYFQEALSLYGLDEEIRLYQEALALILYDENDGSTDEEREEIEEAAAVLYAKAHQRYVKTATALQDVQQNYIKGAYGACPRLQCRQQHMLPYGSSYDSGKCVLRGFCPCCRGLYKLHMRSELHYVDGCFFGPDLVGMFLMSYPEYVVPEQQAAEPLADAPRVHGFEIYNRLLQRHAAAQ